MRVLILGGTGEARELAAELVAAGVDVLSSLAGRVRQPRLPDGPVRVGGFGGAEGLAAFLRAEQITAVIDATHPFAGAITANAAQAAAQAGVPLLVLRRPEWEAAPSWDLVADIGAAAAAVRAWPGESVFLTTGRRDLGVFAADHRHRFLVRAVDPPDGPVPPRMTLVLDRGPYTVAGESALMREHGVGAARDQEQRRADDRGQAGSGPRPRRAGPHGAAPAAARGDRSGDHGRRRRAVDQPG